MKKMFLSKKCLSLCLLGLSVFSNKVISQLSVPNNGIVKFIQKSQDLWPTLLEFDPELAPPFIEGQAIGADKEGAISYLTETKFINSNEDETGQKHYRYQQTYQGIPIENAVLAVHVKNGRVVFQNGLFVKEFPSNLSDVTTHSLINQEEALKYALTSIHAEKYAWEDDFSEQQIKEINHDPKATNYPKAELVWYAGEKTLDVPSLKLAYRLNIYALYPLSNQTVYIDATNGELLGKQNLICTFDVPGKANTAFMGVQNITADFDNVNMIYTLHDNTRNVTTYNMEMGSVYQEKDFMDDDNSWFDQKDSIKGFPVLDQYGADAHWGAEMVYDYYKKKFNRVGLDGKGYPLISYVNTDLKRLGRFSDNSNAFWNGKFVTFGMGDSELAMKPFVSIDIVGHEFTHAVIQSSCGLNGNKEAAALNEGFSDIFGVLIKLESKPNARWIQGEGIGKTIRDMEDPKGMNKPDYYGGQYWDNQEEPHQNSTVLSHWFYLLSQGGSGTNEGGDFYNVDGIGKEKAGRIAYNTVVSYLIPMSNYSDAVRGTIKVAEALYGKLSDEVQEVKNAWIAVGLEGSILDTYCTSRGDSRGAWYINKFTVDALDQTKISHNLLNYISGDNGGYLNHTNKDTITLTKMTFNNFNVYPNPNLNFKNTPLTAKIWIDYDHNGSFELKDALGLNEEFTLIPQLIFEKGRLITKLSMSNYIVPFNALNGPVRMRVTMKYGLFDPGACEFNLNGEVEDYTVNIESILVKFPIYSSEQKQENNILSNNNIQVNIYPNPFSTTIIFNINNADIIKNNFSITISDAFGRIVRRIDNIHTNQIKLNRDNLPKGIYYYQLFQNNSQVNKGKLIVQ